jgi:hypothetical protein
LGVWGLGTVHLTLGMGAHYKLKVNIEVKYLSLKK